MAAPSFRNIFKALDSGGVRYVAVGGVAVNLHGFTRFTKDLDLCIDLEPEHARSAMGVLEDLGFEPRLPVEIMDFAEPDIRREWNEQRNMEVFQLSHREDDLRSIDVFVKNPIPFEELWNEAEIVELESVPARIASIEHLISLKKMAGRVQDHEDIIQLRRLERPQGDSNDNV